MTKLLTDDPAVQNYGQECYSEGFSSGYSWSIADRRIRKAKLKRITDAKFKKVLGHIETIKD